MKVTTFTDTMIRKLKAGEKKFTRGEGNGFSIRVMPSGAKTWLYIFNFDGKRREMNLGSYPDVTLETARSTFDTSRKKVKNGIDPIAELEAKAEARIKAPTVKELCEEYIERHAKRFKRSWAKDERMLKYDVVPAWGKRKAADIAKRDVVLLTEKIINRGSPGMANNTFRLIRKMFNWAVEQDILIATPCLGVKQPSPIKACKRVLDEAEIKTFWNNLEKCNLSTEAVAALKLILITAQRSGEVIGMHIDELDGDWWTIPPERAKNGKAHRVFLTSMALEIINDAVGYAKQMRDIPEEEKYSGFIFPCPHLTKKQSISPSCLSVGVNRNVAEGNNNFDLEPFTPHDLRRTTATFMAESGEMDEVIDAILNHSKQGVIKVYNQYRYEKEKQMALESWSRKLSNITTGTKTGQLIQMKRKTA